MERIRTLSRPHDRPRVRSGKVKQLRLKLYMALGPDELPTFCPGHNRLQIMCWFDLGAPVRCIHGFLTWFRHACRRLVLNQVEGIYEQHVNLYVLSVDLRGARKFTGTWSPYMHHTAVSWPSSPGTSQKAKTARHDKKNPEYLIYSIMYHNINWFQVW